MCDTLRIYAYPSHKISPSLFNNCMRPSQNLPLPPRIYPLFNNYMYMRPSQIIRLLPEYIYLHFNNYMRHLHYLPPPPHLPRIYPCFQQLYYYATLPESIPPSRNIPPFQQLYETLPENTPPSEDTPSFFDNYMQHPPPPSLSEYIIPHLSTTICDIPRITDAPGLFLETTCNCERIYHSLPELKNILGERCRSGRVAHINWLKRGVYSGREGYILGGSHNIIVVKKGGIFWEGGYILGGSHTVVEKGGIFWVGGRGRFWEGLTYTVVEKEGIFWEGYSC